MSLVLTEVSESSHGSELEGLVPVGVGGSVGVDGGVVVPGSLHGSEG